MLLITEKADVRCTHAHSGRIQIPASQNWVTISGVPIPVEADPLLRDVVACTLPSNARCFKTAAVLQGYSDLLRIGGKRICLDTLKGPTVAVPPGAFEVVDPAQKYVEEKA
jgi:hypothetical protein